MPSTPDVAALELLAASTWRGLEEQPLGSWLLRAGNGFTGRANSVLVAGPPPGPLDEAVAAVTAWYTARGLRPRAQLPRPGGEEADAAFAAAGWTRDDDVLVLTAPLDALLDRGPAGVRVDLAAEPDGAWLAGYRYRGAVLPPGARSVLLGADEPVFAAVRSAPPPAPLDAVGRGAVAGGRLVLTALTVAEPARRRGLATAVTAALAGWGAGRGASSCLLQVAADNAPALALYARLGFTEHHRYWYRSAP